MDRVLSQVPCMSFHELAEITASRRAVIHDENNRTCREILDKALGEQLEANLCSGFVVGIWGPELF